MTQACQKERTRLLVEAFIGGDDQAFSEIYDLYVNMLFNFGLRFTTDQELVKDCIHDVFTKVYAKRGSEAAIRNLGSYLLIAMKNRLLDEFRRQGTVDDLPAETLRSYRASDDVEAAYVSNEHQRRSEQQVMHLMRFLTKRQRQAVTLYYLEERRYDEVCEIMQMSYHSVRNLMHRSLRRLRQMAGQ